MATQTYDVVLDKEEDGGYSVQCVEIRVLSVREVLLKRL
jgi:predicted RNase H-like HicB family nuclease